MAGVVAAVAVGVGVSAIGTAVAAGQQKKAARRARNDKERLTDELDQLELDRQEVINPYSDVVSLDDMIVDNSDILSNPFQNIGVATQAAKFQAEEADIALANTLDTLLASGASAGGATALAQAALQSKRNISASLEQQETNNQKLAAQGEQFLQQQQMSEAQRIQQAQMTEAQRIQQAEVLGKEFVYGETERRETEQMNRKQAQITGSAQAEIAANQNRAAITTAGIGAIGGIASAGITAEYGK